MTVASVGKTVRAKREAVPADVFVNFLASGETENLTQAECAAKLKMSKPSFSQRLTAYRKERRLLIAGGADQSKLPPLPKFKADKRGGGVRGKRKERSATAEALLKFLEQ